MPGGLDASRWAPKPNRIDKRTRRPRRASRSSSTPLSLSNPQADNLLLQLEDQPSPEQEFSRLLKIIARLNWKLPFLKQGYSLAKDCVGKEQAQVEACEIQFKLDFHEFYMLIERALVRLMAIFGIIIKGNGILIDGSFRMNESRADNMLQDSDGPPIHHWYHANVLTALEDPRNPLHGIFGTPEVRKQLLRAKDLRNRWKNIDEAEPEKFKPPPLSAYNLDQIVQTILAAIEQAHEFAAEHIRTTGGELAKSNGGAAGQEDWEFMVDAMDWEAV
ncbi:hypothetical protein F5Y06DRAFT_275292 [Hypoxylon sp. FL0890]|nr:hypothetical protein F5Y06DRAFT_275292 [Hypoxylon sp. FL0890]